MADLHLKLAREFSDINKQYRFSIGKWSAMADAAIRINNAGIRAAVASVIAILEKGLDMLSEDDVDHALELLRKLGGET